MKTGKAKGTPVKIAVRCVFFQVLSTGLGGTAFAGAGNGLEGALEAVRGEGALGEVAHAAPDAVWTVHGLELALVCHRIVMV